LSNSRESVGGVLALFGGLALLGMTFSGQCSRSARAVDVGSFLEAAFDPKGFPEGWQVQACEAMPDGRTLMRLSSLGEPAPEFVVGEEESAALAKIPKGLGRKGPRPWMHLKERLGLGASAALLVQHPLKTSMDERKRLFRGLGYKTIEQVEFKGEAIPMNAGRLAWGLYEVPWVHIRHFERVDDKPTFHDTIRVDLSSGPQAMILYLTFPPRARGAEIALDPFITAWAPLIVEPAKN